MAGEPAITKVLAAMEAALGTISGLSVFLNRSDMEPLGEDAWPAALIYVTDIDWTRPMGSQSETVHVFKFEIECQSGGEDIGAIDLVNQATIASINAVLANDPTLGGRLEDISLLGASGSTDGHPNVGAATVSGEGSFRTPSNDFTTINGHGGLIF